MQQTHNLLILGSSPSGPTTLLLRLDIVRYNNRTVAQPGSASALGAEGRRFESSLSDQFLTGDFYGKSC